MLRASCSEAERRAGSIKIVARTVVARSTSTFRSSNFVRPFVYFNLIVQFLPLAVHLFDFRGALREAHLRAPRSVACETWHHRRRRPPIRSCPFGPLRSSRADCARGPTATFVLLVDFLHR